MEQRVSAEDAYSNFIYLRTYSRWNENEGRRETWNETVDRYMAFMRENVGSSLSNDDYLFLRNSIINQEALPSMRLLWSAGEAARVNHSAAYNCLARETKFVTSSGVKSFSDYEDGDEVTVLTHQGRWKRAVVRSYGKQELKKHRFCKSSGKKVYYDVWATETHRWILRNGIKKEGLEVGDKIAFSKDIFSEFDYHEADVDEKLYWAYGYVYGDGTVTTRNGIPRYSLVRLCKKDSGFRERFEELGWKTSSSLSLEGDFIAFTGSYLKTLPDPSKDDPRLIRAFVRGFLDADGARNDCSCASLFASIQSTGRKSIDFIRSCFPIAGVFIVNEKQIPSDTGYGRTAETVRFIIHNAVGETRSYTVEEISGSRIEDVWCLDVEDDHSFVLEGGLITGNCTFAPIDDLKAFPEALFLLTSGAGVGFSCEKENVDKLPTIKPFSGGRLDVYTIPDSREGWADALKVGLNTWYDGRDVHFDYSRIRPLGSILKTFGGRASGPDPLKKLLDFTRSTILNAAGRKLRSIEAHDIMCMIAQVVVAGGTRRSSLISLSDLDDDEMRYAKTGNIPTHRYMANNSAVYKDSIVNNELFDEEWRNLMLSGSGERGIFNRDSSLSQVPSRRRSLMSNQVGCNPCQPAWASVLTPTGLKTIGDIAKGDLIWSSEGWTKVVAKWSTGTNEVYSYRTSAGVFYGTEEHRVVSFGEKVEAKSADSIDSLAGYSEDETRLSPPIVMDGLVLGDGSVHKASNNLVYLYIGENDSSYFDSEIASLIRKHRPGIKETAYEVVTGIKASELPLTYERVVPKRYMYSGASVAASFLRGLFSANGSVANNRVQLKTSSKQLAVDVQIMLSSLGIKSYITGINSGPHTVQFKNGVYECRKSYSVNITTGRKLFAEKIGFIQDYKNEKINADAAVLKEKITFDIIERSFVSVEETFDITVDNQSHTYWTGGCNVSNCAEILLNPRTMCNLTNVVGRPEDTLKSLMTKVKAATILGTYQSTLTDFSYLSPEWKANCESERLLGVSLTGVYDNLLLRDGRVLSILRDYAVYVNKIYAEKLGINQSVAVTCVKPSGNTSQLVNSSSGAHPRYSDYYIRRVRIASTDPLFEMMKAQGVPYHPENGQTVDPSTYVLEFPLKSPKSSITRKDITALQQLDLWLTLRRNFTEHTVSATVYVAFDEWGDVKSWLKSNWRDVSGLSFLPKEDENIKYSLAPYEEIDESEYLKRSNSLRLNFDHLSFYENSDNTSGAKEYACTSGACEL